MPIVAPNKSGTISGASNWTVLFYEAVAASLWRALVEGTILGLTRNRRAPPSEPSNWVKQNLRALSSVDTSSCLAESMPCRINPGKVDGPGTTTQKADRLERVNHDC